jgi:cytochrome c
MTFLTTRPRISARHLRLATSLLIIALGLVPGACSPSEPLTADAAAAVKVADAKRGAELYEARCATCHAIDVNRFGPAHRGVVGRKAGTVPGYHYSDALKRAGFVWDDAHLDAWLADPDALVPGQEMSAHVARARDRIDLIAYLHTL